MKNNSVLIIKLTGDEKFAMVVSTISLIQEIVKGTARIKFKYYQCRSSKTWAEEVYGKLLKINEEEGSLFKLLKDKNPFGTKKF